MRRGTKYAWACFGLNSFAMFSCIGAAQITGLEELKRVAIGLACSELALFTIGVWTQGYESCCWKARPPIHIETASDDLELDSQKSAGSPDKAPSPLAENKPVPTDLSPRNSQLHSEAASPPSSATYIPVRRVSV